MKAIAWTKYGSPNVLVLKEFKKPSPKNDEVLISIQASTVTVGDCKLRALRIPFGFWLPTRLMMGVIKPRKPISGMEISGLIEAVGKDVHLFKVGDEVYGTTGLKLGANAQYICLPESAALVTKPTNISHEEAVSIIFGGLTALHFLKDKVDIQKGQKVLVNGASGAVGTASLQLLKYLGAEITAVCSATNTELVKSLGANEVINYEQEDFTKGERNFDVILDAVGNLSLRQCKSCLSKNGKLILLNSDLSTNLFSIFSKTLICGVAAETKENLKFLSERCENGDIKAIIDKTFPLSRTADAHRYVDSGRKKGSVVITTQH